MTRAIHAIAQKTTNEHHVQMDASSLHNQIPLKTLHFLDAQQIVKLTISECDECDDGYFKSDSQCLSCSKNCSTCSVTRTNCTSCSGGFYLKDSFCLSCAENCLACTGPESYEYNVCVEGYIIF